MEVRSSNLHPGSFLKPWGLSPFFFWDVVGQYNRSPKSVCNWRRTKDPLNTGESNKKCAKVARLGPHDLPEFQYWKNSL